MTLKSQCVLTIALLSSNNSTVPFRGFANINLKPSRSPCTHQQFTKTSAKLVKRSHNVSPLFQKRAKCLVRAGLLSTIRPFNVAHAICCCINTGLADICMGSMQRFLPQGSILIRITSQQYRNMYERLHGSSHVHSSNRSKT